MCECKLQWRSCWRCCRHGCCCSAAPSKTTSKTVVFTNFPASKKPRSPTEFCGTQEARITDAIAVLEASSCKALAGTSRHKLGKNKPSVTPAWRLRGHQHASHCQRDSPHTHTQVLDVERLSSSKGKPLPVKGSARKIFQGNPRKSTLATMLLQKSVSLTVYERYCCKISSRATK